MDQDVALLRGSRGASDSVVAHNETPIRVRVAGPTGAWNTKYPTDVELTIFESLGGAQRMPDFHCDLASLWARYNEDTEFVVEFPVDYLDGINASVIKIQKAWNYAQRA